MMPGTDREKRRKKHARVAGFIALSAVAAVTVLLRPGYQWVSLTVGVCGAIAVAASDLPGGRGRPGPYRELTKKRARAGGFIGCGTIIISGLFQPAWQWLPFAVSVPVVVAVLTSGGLRGGGRRGHGRGSGLSRDGRDVDGPAGAAHRWACCHGVAADAWPRGPPVACGGGKPAVGDRARRARRGDAQLPAVRAQARGDDVGTRGPAAGAAWPATPWITAVCPVVLHRAGQAPGAYWPCAVLCGGRAAGARERGGNARSRRSRRCR